MVPSPHEPATCHRMGWFNMRVANVSAVGFGQRVLKLEEFYTAMTEEEIRERLGVVAWRRFGPSWPSPMLGFTMCSNCNMIQGKFLDKLDS